MHCKQNSIESHNIKNLHVPGASQLSTQVVETIHCVRRPWPHRRRRRRLADGRDQVPRNHSPARAAFDGQTAAKSASLVTVVILLSLSLTTIRPS